MSLESLIESLVYSDFLERTRVLANQEPSPPTYRPLTEKEISQLEHQGNRSSDWTNVRVINSFSTQGVWNNRFRGTCVLGQYSGKPRTYSVSPTHEHTYTAVEGITDSVIIDSWIGSGSSVENCHRIQGVKTGTDVVLAGSSISFTKECHFGNGHTIPIGVEIGGRPIQIFADLSLQLAVEILDNPGNKDHVRTYTHFVDQYKESICDFATLIDNNAIVLDTRNLTNSYVGNSAWIHQADSIENSTIISTVQDPTEVGPGTIIRNSIIQEGVVVDTGALVFTSLLFEHSYATEHGKVQDTIVGPNSGVSLGEATASFMGPFVGFHHQSLLIANYWPGGKGNIGYGANVGSNHTSRMPDQECWPGEGMFFGLSSVIKYPANFRQAPYSIVAAGVTTLPQKMTCPFSLINEPVAYYLEVPPGFNNLIPAWGLTDNLYSLKRNEGKYKARNKAKRNSFELELFRPEIIQYMTQAVIALKQITERKTIYFPSDIPAIGKNMMTDVNRLKAIEAYEFFILLTKLKNLRDSILLGIQPQNSEEAKKGLQTYLSMVPELLIRTVASKERDFARGSAIIDDYHQTHLPVEQDPFVKQTKKEVELEIENTFRALEKLK
jgi:carbonic anhydrase/acetyltransferase-like protein (isoleucine patch superfamily)